MRDEGGMAMLDERPDAQDITLEQASEILHVGAICDSLEYTAWKLICIDGVRRGSRRMRTGSE
jgi:hypothetical protein